MDSNKMQCFQEQCAHDIRDFQEANSTPVNQTGHQTFILQMTTELIWNQTQ